MIKSMTRNREFAGPTPHAVAILARPSNKRPAEHLILERRRIEDLREQSIADSRYNKQCDLKSAWERTTDKRIQKNIVKRQMESYFRNEQSCLEDRRQKLREMLLAEEDAYIQEMESMQETVQERQQNMKDRAQGLREKREKERLALVQDKLDLKFRSECEELRAAMSKQARDDVFADRDVQLQMKANEKETHAKLEQFYSEMWESDMKAKAALEEQKTKEQIERNLAALEVLNLQKSATEAQKNEEKLRKQLEAEWLKEEAAIRAHEDAQMKVQKQQKQMANKRSHDRSIKLKDKKKAMERQEQIALDMQMLSKVLEETHNQAAEDLQKKRNANEEVQRFMHYSDKSRAEKTCRERQLEQFMNEEVEKQWQARDERKAMEKRARQTMMNSVLQTREQQIREREETIRREQASAMRERQELRSQMEEHKRLEAEHVDRIREQNRLYQKDLEEQINYQRRIKEKEIEQARKEIEALQNSELEYRKRLQSALNSPDLRKTHPLRIAQKSALTDRAMSC